MTKVIGFQKAITATTMEGKIGFLFLLFIVLHFLIALNDMTEE